MPQNALDKLVRDVGTFDAEGNQVNVTSKKWNRAVIIIGISDDLDKDGDGVEDISIPDIIQETQINIDKLSIENDWEGKNLTMTLTGPVPLTNAITEESFKLFWKVFPFGVIAVSAGLFIFHCDILQTGRPRIVQGIKTVIITGLPTLCSVWVTLGIIGYSDYEVTMTVIIVGPIVLALGVSYGLHITNRYAEAKGTPKEKIDEALNSTGRAVFSLSNYNYNRIYFISFYSDETDTNCWLVFSRGHSSSIFYDYVDGTQLNVIIRFKKTFSSST